MYLSPFNHKRQKTSQKPSPSFCVDPTGQNCVSWSLLAGREVVEASILSIIPQTELRFISKKGLKIALGIKSEGMGGSLVLQKKVRDQ